MKQIQGELLQIQRGKKHKKCIQKLAIKPKTQADSLKKGLFVSKPNALTIFGKKRNLSDLEEKRFGSARLSAFVESDEETSFFGIEERSPFINGSSEEFENGVVFTEKGPKDKFGDFGEAEEENFFEAEGNEEYAFCCSDEDIEFEIIYEDCHA